MIKHPELQQGSVPWLEARCSLVTASEAKQLLTPKLAIRKGEMVQTLLATKLAERWLGPLPAFSAWATDQGTVLEQSAFDCFAFEHDARVERLGFITTDDGRAGCSPDGWLPDAKGFDCGVEIKSLQPVHHIKAVLDGDLPEEFAAQVHFSLWVTGCSHWKFFAYSRRLPHLLITVPREDAIQATIQEAMEAFLAAFDLAWDRLCDKNGGPPPPRKVFVPSDGEDPRAHLFEGLPGQHDEVGFIG